MKLQDRFFSAQTYAKRERSLLASKFSKLARLLPIQRKVTVLDFGGSENWRSHAIQSSYVPRSPEKLRCCDLLKNVEILARLSDSSCEETWRA